MWGFSPSEISCIYLFLERQLAQVIFLPDWDAVVTEDRVRRGDVEIDVRDRVLSGVLEAGSVLPFPARLRDVFFFRSLEVRGLH